MKGQKGEGAKQNEVKGATERGPLFPRLHVNETEKAGPKAPPRNKMALYEQFTVPSHRFVQPSQKPATTMYQQQYGMRELGYPYVPYYIPSGPNHGVSMYPQPSHNTSSSGVISDGAVNEKIRQNASRQQKSGKSSPCKVSRHLTEATADCSIKSLPAQKDKADFVPAQSSLTNQAEESTNSLQNAPSDMEGPHVTDITESLHDALSTVVEVGTDGMGPDVRTCELPKGRDLVNSTRGTCLTDEDKLKQTGQLSIFEMLTQPTKKGNSGPLDKSAVQSCLQTESSRDVCKADCALTSHLHDNMRCGTFIEPKDLEERSNVNAHCQSSLSSENQAIMDIQSASTSSESLDNNVHKNASKHPTTELAKADFPKLGTATSEVLKLIQNRTSQASQTTQCETCKEGHSDVSVMPSFSLDTEWIIKPKDVIQAVGQQQFWKARKKLLRQQRIFSDQVFQLHKLIKIQQLLAETPGTLMDEEMHFEAEEDCDATITSAKRATGSSENAKNVAFNNNEGSKCKSSEAEDQGNKKEGQTQEDGKVGVGSNACRPESSSVGVSAWGYPSLGPWAGPMAAQGGPFPYPPFAGAFPPGSAFGLPVGPLFPGSMMSFGIPFYDGRREPPAEVDSNYGPPGTSKHEGRGTASVNSNHVSNDLAASWYFSQYNHHVNNHRSLAGGSYKDAPTGSGASVNNSFATAQAVKAPCLPGLSYQWGVNCQAGLVNTDGLENSAHQSEHSSPIDATRFSGRMLSTASKPLAKPLGFLHRDAEGLVQNLDPANTHRSNSLNQFDSSKKFLEKEKSVMRTSSLSNHHQEEAVCLSVNCPSTDVNPSALELFPLVPSLSSSGGRVVKAREEGQGGIIRAVPRRAVAASKSAAGILLSLQRERQK